MDPNKSINGTVLVPFIRSRRVTLSWNLKHLRTTVISNGQHTKTTTHWNNFETKDIIFKAKTLI